MFLLNFLKFLLYSVLILHCLSEESVSAETNSTSTSTTIVDKSETTTDTTTTSTSPLLSCPGGHNNPPTCTQCPAGYENINSSCVEIKDAAKLPSRSTGRRSALIFLLCFLSIIGIATILIVYRRSNQQRRRRGVSTSANVSNAAVFNTNTENRFGRILRSFGWNSSNRRGPFNFFSISNNNQSSGQYRPAQTTPGDVHENLDEALLFDDPYADGGLQSSSANPYKSLTLAIT